MNEESTPLDYARADTAGTRRDPPRPGDGGRVVACSVIVLAGAVMMGGGLIAEAAGSVVGGGLAGWGIVPAVLGMLGFLIEIVRDYRR